MGYRTFSSEERVNQRLREEGPLGPVLPPPRLPSVEEIHAYRHFIGSITTQTYGQYDLGLQLNQEKGVWIYAAALSYPEMLEEYTRYPWFSDRDWLEKILALAFIGY